MDNPVRDKTPNVEPAKSGELSPVTKPEKPPLPRQAKLTEDLADDFFGGIGELYEPPAAIEERVQITHYDPSLPISSNYAEKVMQSLAHEPLDYERVGVLQKGADGALVIREIKNQGDVEEHKKIQQGEIIFKHVGNAVRLVMSQTLREALGKEGIQALKEEANRLFSTKEQPNLPVEVTTLKTEDWQTKVPQFFASFAAVLPPVAKQTQSNAQAQGAATATKQQAATVSSKTEMTSSKRERSEETRQEISTGRFPESSTKKIQMLEAKFRQHDWQVKESAAQLDKELDRKKQLGQKNE